MDHSTEYPGTYSFRAFGTLHDDPSKLPLGVQSCYEALFPIPQERDKYPNILKWLREGNQSPQAAWAELFVTMQNEGGSCVGIIFLSLYRPLGWWFGNYFGVLKGSREQGRPLEFWDYAAARCEAILPTAKGIVFETERYEDSDAESALAKYESSVRVDNVSLTKEERFSATAALRIARYTSYGLGPAPAGVRRGVFAMFEVDGNVRLPVDYVQPAMDLPLDRSNEVPLWLMIHPFSPLLSKMTGARDADYPLSTSDVDEVLEFLYGHVFRYAYAKRHEDEASDLPVLEGYDEYLEEVHMRVLHRLAGKQIILSKRDILSNTVQKLLGRYGGYIRD